MLNPNFLRKKGHIWSKINLLGGRINMREWEMK